tara:strand:- start:128 stop:1084 length:957 start_codon:yes stop_codon:yes gene_type:complete
MKNRKLLVVYNTCGIKRDNTDWYIECINSLLNQDFDDYRVVLSSCLNSPECFKKIYDTFGNKISYCYHAEPHTVNITFNKTVQECVREFGEFESYLYVDSGCTLGDSSSSLRDIYDSYKLNSYGILSIQTDTDTCFQSLGLNLKNNSDTPQIVNEDYILPIGKAINLHLFLFDSEIYKRYNKILPDVFAAYCSESVLSFISASVNKRWAIMKELQVKHRKSIDGATLCVPHHSPIYRNHWNNLLYGRNALDFINDKEARNSGLGYEECNNIMKHNPDAYDSDGNALNKEELSRIIEKYLFLSKNEINYDKIKIKFVAN